METTTCGDSPGSGAFLVPALLLGEERKGKAPAAYRNRKERKKRVEFPATEAFPREHGALSRVHAYRRQYAIRDGRVPRRARRPAIQGVSRQTSGPPFSDRPPMAFSFVLVGIISVVLALTSCAPVAREWRDPALRKVTYSMTAENPSAYTGASVLWGGTVLGSRPLPGVMEMTIAQSPLDAQQRPVADIIEGNFIARSSKYFNPGGYKNGSVVSVIGTIVGEERRDAGPVKNVYPVVEIKEIHIWVGKIRPSPDLFSGFFGPFRQPFAAGTEGDYLTVPP
jgi:outer membrane lipoprotein